MPSPGVTENDSQHRPRTHRVLGDGMAPTLVAGRDLALIVPTDRYGRDGLYAVSWLGSDVDIIRVQHIGGGRLRLLRDNPAYAESCGTVGDFAQIVTLGDFAQIVIGRIVGRIEFYDRWLT